MAESISETGSRKGDLWDAGRAPILLPNPRDPTSRQGISCTHLLQPPESGRRQTGVRRQGWTLRPRKEEARRRYMPPTTQRDGEAGGGCPGHPKHPDLAPRYLLRHGSGGGATQGIAMTSHHGVQAVQGCGSPHVPRQRSLMGNVVPHVFRGKTAANRADATYRPLTSLPGCSTPKNKLLSKKKVHSPTFHVTLCPPQELSQRSRHPWVSLSGITP